MIAAIALVFIWGFSKRAEVEVELPTQDETNNKIKQADAEKVSEVG
jgi:hypothetical protein